MLWHAPHMALRRSGADAARSRVEVPTGGTLHPPRYVCDVTVCDATMHTCHVTMWGGRGQLHLTPKQIPFCSALGAWRADAYPGRVRPRDAVPRTGCTERVPVVLP